jgi:hypothetical protein
MRKEKKVMLLHLQDVNDFLTIKQIYNIVRKAVRQLRHKHGKGLRFCDCYVKEFCFIHRINWQFFRYVEGLNN